MHLLPKKKIISAFRGIVSLSDYSDLAITTSMVQRFIWPLPNPQLWQHKFPHSAINLSRPFDSQDCVRVMSLSSTSLYGIRIDHTDEPFSENHVTVKRLISAPSLDRFLVKKIKKHRKIIHRPLFDPGSGRVVIFFVGRFVVVDLALVCKDS